MGDAELNYTNPSFPGSFAGLSTYRRYEPKADLSATRAYTLHKNVTRNFPRNKIVVAGIDALWEADLSDVSKFAQVNNKTHFLLCVIDVFSKFSWVLPMKSKTAAHSLKTFKILFQKTNRRPKAWRFDKGGEFTNRLVLDFLKKNNIKSYFSQNNDTKCAIVERFQRTLKGRMWRFFSHTRQYSYINILDKIVESINHTYHRTIGCSPSQVTKENEAVIWNKIYGTVLSPIEKFKFNVGDMVRISTTRMVFKKGYEQQWSEELFKIIKAIPRRPPVYKLNDLNGELIIGSFYAQELQKVSVLDDEFIVEKVLEERTYRGVKKYLVKWLGYNKSFNSWVTSLHG